jgi:hypothetical protein
VDAPVIGHAAQRPPQSEYPLLQARLQLAPSHDAWPEGSVGQGTQLLPQVASVRPSTHAPEQRWNGAAHAQAWVATLQVSFGAHCVSNAQPAWQRPVVRSQ